MKERRNTMQKELTLEAVRAFDGHPSAEDVYRVISRKYSTISKATVYRNLTTLCQEGKISRVSGFDGGEAHYDHRLDPHMHGFCVRCGKVVDIEADVFPESLCLNARCKEDDGFVITSRKLVFEGICTECREKEKENGVERVKDRTESPDSVCR